MRRHTLARKTSWWLLATLAILASTTLLSGDLAWSSSTASQGTVVDTPDGPRHDTQSEPAALTGRVVTLPATGPADPYTHWRVEFNTGCMFADHLLSIPVAADPADMDDIILTMTNWDVDYVDETGECTAGAEVDRTYSNSGRHLGILRGANDQWSTNSWPLERKDVANGDNVIRIDTDATETDCWCVGVGWAEIKAKVGFQVKSAKPSDGQQGVPFKRDEAVIEITFNLDYDPETITSNSVYLYYENQVGGKVKVPYTRLDTSTSNVLRIQPKADLKDGVKYEIKVTQEVKTPNEKALEKPWTSSFWTLLNLEGENAVGQDKIQTVPIQVSRGSRFIPDKPAVYRVFIRWDEKGDVHPDWQLEKADFVVDLKIGAAGLQQTATVTRPNKLTVDERRRAASSINFFYTPSAGSGALEAKVTQTPQQASPAKSFTANGNVDFAASSPRIKYDFWNIRANIWTASGVPPAAQAWGRHTIQSGAQFTTDVFPVIQTEVSIKGDTAPFPFTSKGAGVAPNCAGCQLGLCPPYTVGDDARWEWECTARRLWELYGATARASDSPWVSGMSPQGVLPGATGWQWDIPGGGTIFIIQYDTGANAGTVAHEATHAAGIGPHVDNITNVRGFRVRTGANKSFDDDIIHAIATGFNPEGNKVLTNLMNTSATPTLSRWIDHFHYETIINHFQNLASGADAPMDSTSAGYLLLSGDIVDDSTVLIRPALRVDFAAFGVPTYTVPMPYSIVQYSGATPLSTTYFSPTYMGDGLHVTFPNSLSYGVNPPPGSAPYLSFVTAVPFEPATDRVEIQHDGVPILTIHPTAHAPQIAFSAPTDGATLTGMVNITWTASDPDGDTLYTMLQWSEDGGASYAPLTELVTGLGQYNMDTTRVHSTNQGRLKLLATDGFNTSVAVIDVMFDNPPGVEAYEPAPGTKEVPHGQPVSVWFNSPMQASEFISDEISIECSYAWMGSYEWISGTLSYDSTTRRATLIPFEPLPYENRCNVYVEAGLLNTLGRQLPQVGWTWKEDKYFRYAATWSFNTAVDTDNPVIGEVFPRPSEVDVPTNALVAVLFDDRMQGSTINSDTLYLTNAAGTKIPGSWTLSYDWSRSYDDRPEGAIFRPSSPLLPGATYTATVTTGITDWRGNPLEVGKSWSFTTGDWASSGIRILGEYGEWVEDDDHDGVYDRLMIDVAIESALDDAAAGWCDLNAELLDKFGIEVGWATLATNAYCDIGVYRKVLAFSGAEIRSHGVDGPYLLDEVYLYYTDVPAIYDSSLRAHTTRPYSATDFSAVLTFGGLPDVVLASGDTMPVVIDLTQYAWHVSLPAVALNYTLLSVTDPHVAANITAPGVLEIKAPALWAGEAEVFVRASAGTHTAVDSFLVTRGAVQQPFSLYLPVVLHGAAGDRAAKAP